MFKCQGQTLGSVYIDIRKPPPPWNLDSFGTYVALSHSKGCEMIGLLGDFNGNLFMKHPLEDLRNEDLRLAELTASTKVTYNNGLFNSFSFPIGPVSEVGNHSQPV